MKGRVYKDAHGGLLPRLLRTAATLLIVHAQVALPLTVVCIRADGTAIIEIAGQDPCREACTWLHGSTPIPLPFPQMEYDRRPPEPCRDLSVYIPADLGGPGFAPAGRGKLVARMPADAEPAPRAIPSRFENSIPGESLILPRAPAGYWPPIRI